MENWTTTMDGGSGEWRYGRLVGDRVYVFIRILDLVDACGKDANAYFHSDVCIVDLNYAAETDSLESALISCDFESFGESYEGEKKDFVMAECCLDYGSYSPMWSDDSGEIDKENDDWEWDVPNDHSEEFVSLLERSRKWAEENLLDEETRNHLLDTTIVNKIGQSAREFSGGVQTLWDSLRRIKEDPNATPAQKIILNMYSVCEHTLGAGPVPEDLKKSKD